MNTLLIATRNRHKTGEFSAILGASFHVEDLTSYADFPEVEETGATFLQNAGLKAVSASRYTETPETFVLADDSGLETDALSGAPGIRSARFAGEKATDLQNLELLLSKLAGVSNRGARFRCAMAVAKGGKLLAGFEGSCEGRIIEEPRGHNGFGYDPVFVPAGYAQTFAELSPEVKNQISHRAKAFQQALAWLRGV